MPSLFTEASKTVLGTQKTLEEKKVNWDQERQVTPGHKAKQFVSLISQQMVQCYSRYTVTFTESRPYDLPPCLQKYLQSIPKDWSLVSQLRSTLIKIINL